MDNKESTSIQQDLQKQTADLKIKKVRFVTLRAWITYLASIFMKDIGKIPDNIGNRMLITNNMYITKKYMSSIIQIEELGEDSVVTLIGELNRALREKGNKCILDVIIKNQRFNFEPNNSGLKSRVASWERLRDNPLASKKYRKRAIRCLYTYDVAMSGKRLKESRIFLIIRAKEVAQLDAGENIVLGELNSMGARYKGIYGNVKDTLKYISIMGGRKAEKIKQIAPVMTSNQVLADMMPNNGSYNDRDGIDFGVNISNCSTMRVDLANITKARNIYVTAPSGVGKTVLVTNIAESAYEQGMCCVFTDIKGNEYTNFIKATDGYIVSLRPNSIEYINSWVMHQKDTSFENAVKYFKERINFSKTQMKILSGITDKEQLGQFEELLDEFHDSLYVSVGAIPENPKSWRGTEELNPKIVYEKFRSFCTEQKIRMYDIRPSVLGMLKMYFATEGSKSYAFTKEFDYEAILRSDTLSFDFGLLAGGGSKTYSREEIDLFRLKFLYMSKLNGDFITRKYSMGKHTVKVLEESQIVDDDILQMYVEEYTLRRSQNQHTFLLGNSVTALTNNEISKPLIENTTGLLIGDLTMESRETVIQQFDIQYLRDKILSIGSTKELQNAFLFVNKMQDRQLYPILKIVMDVNKKSKMHVPVKEEIYNEESIS